MMEFPYEAVPDGDVLAPHHLYFGALALLLAAWMVSDDYRDREAWVVALGALTSLVAFALTWRHYPTVGAGLTLLGLLVALAAVVVRPYWAGYSWVGLRGAALLAVLVALDDAVEHAFPIVSPLDWFWTEYLFVAIQAIEAFTA